MTQKNGPVWEDLKPEINPKWFSAHGWLPLPDETEVDPPESPDDDWREEADPIGTSDGKPVDDAALAHDIRNRQAQGILNRTLETVRGISAAARSDLDAALRQIATGDTDKLLAFIDRYRIRLSKVLTTTQLAALLEGAREVANRVPPLDVPVEGLPVAEQERIIAAARADIQSPTPARTGSADADVHFSTIEEAARNLADRRVVDRAVYDRMEASARAKAFTVAGVQADETLAKIRDSLAENVKEGADYPTWRKKVMEDVGQGTFLSDAHQEVVFRANVQSGFSDGQFEVLQHPLVRSGFPYVARDAIHDDRARHNHLALEKLGIQGTNVYRVDDPVWQLFRVPWDYNDRCGDTFLTVRQAAERGIGEAKEWLDTGVEPADKAWVAMPDFRPPEGFQRETYAASLSIQLSLQPAASFAYDPSEPRDPRGEWTATGGGTATKQDDHPSGGQRGKYKGKGTREDPARCGHDIALAARLLSEGKHIRLKQPDQVSTLTDKMAEMVEEARRKGGAVPNFDLCKISVKGTNLFCQDTLGIPRVKMPQMRGVPTPGTLAAMLPANKKGKVDLSAQFIMHMKKIGIDSTQTHVKASHLRASQNQIVGTRVLQLVDEAEAGDRNLREKPIFVTRDNYVVDGHHHWAAIVVYGHARDKDMSIPVHKLDCDIGQALDLANMFTKMYGLAPKSGGTSQPMSIAESLALVMSTATTKPEEEPDTALLAGQPEVGSIASATLDTAREGKAAKQMKVAKAKTAGGRRLRRSLFRRLRVKKRWRPDHPALSVDAALGQWITIGGEPDAETGEKHKGGFRVFVDESGRITKGRMLGKKVSNVKTAFDKMKGKLHGRQQPAAAPHPGSPAPGKRGRPILRQPAAASGGVAAAPDGPGGQAPGGQGGAPGIPVDPQALGDVAAKRLARVEHRLGRYAEHFRKNGNDGEAEWMDMLAQHVREVGADAAQASLPPERAGQQQPGKVYYAASGAVDLAEAEDDVQWLNDYLNRVGISLTPVAGAPTVASAPLPGIAGAPAKSNLSNKLMESKALPGLETTEDIDTIMGVGGPQGGAPKVNQLTPDVLAKLDEKYGQGKWIIKSYGDESFAGFGIFFPQRVAEIQMSAKGTMLGIENDLKRFGYGIARDEGGKAVGLKDNQNTVFKFGSRKFLSKDRIAKYDKDQVNEINKSLYRLAHAASVSSRYEAGAVLPRLPHDALQQDIGISLDKDSTGNVVGMTTHSGKRIPFKLLLDKTGDVFGVDPESSREFRDLMEEQDDEGALAHEIDRAVISAKKGSNIRFMAQPAFEAVGVSEEDRAAGVTWETSTEGRVHCVTKGGKASPIPYATLARRGDNMPAVFYNDDVRAMEKAVEDAINALPESERQGQVYAPDVMKTKDGWKVVELNASDTTGSSLWLESNPMVMDAFVSHVTGRGDPAHVRFVRNLLSDKMHGRKFKPPTGPAGISAALSQEFEDMHPRNRAGEFAKKGLEKLGTTRTIKHGKLHAKYVNQRGRKPSGPHILFRNYVQMDEHSCGFVAALTLAKFFNPEVKAKEVLRAVRTTVGEGISGPQLRKRLRKLGVETAENESLTVGKLRKYVDQKVPILLTIWPEDWDSDHWVVVKGFDEDGGRIYLTNYPSMTTEEFRRVWYTKGYGLVCRSTTTKPTALSHDVSKESRDEGGKWTAGSASPKAKPGSLVEAARAGLTKLFERVGKKSDEPQQDVKHDTFKRSMAAVLDHAKQIGFKKELFKTNLREDPDVRHYAVTNPNAFNNQVQLLKVHMQNAAHMSDNPEIKKMLMDKVGELSGLVQDVVNFRKARAPEQNATIKTKKGRKNAARDSIKHALAALAANPDARAAVADLVKRGIKESAAKRYVRAALVYAKENIEVE